MFFVLLVWAPVVVSCRLSLYISGAVIRKALVTICNWFISLLVAYSSLLAAAILCLKSYVWLPRMLLSLLCQSLLPTAISLSLLVHWLSAACPLYTLTLAMHVGIGFLCFACWDSMSSFTLECCDSMSSFPGLWLAISDWCLPKGVCCKLGCGWQLFIICTTMGL